MVIPKGMPLLDHILFVGGVAVICALAVITMNVSSEITIWVVDRVLDLLDRKKK